MVSQLRWVNPSLWICPFYCLKAAGCEKRKEGRPLVFEFNERILGNRDFVKEVLAVADKRLERKYALTAKAVGFDHVAQKLANLMPMDVSELFKPGKQRQQVKARSVLCDWAARELDIRMVELGRRLKLSAAVSLSLQREEKIVRENNYTLVGNLKTKGRPLFTESIDLIVKAHRF